MKIEVYPYEFKAGEAITLVFLYNHLLGFAGMSCVLVLISHSSTANKFLIPLEKVPSYPDWRFKDKKLRLPLVLILYLTRPEDHSGGKNKENTGLRVDESPFPFKYRMKI